ncbi:helix-turn-helix transcriptional regulator [Kribbella sp. NPDC056345]|uniref:helix-turn-helix transcriptional regulator n=1 Tax=Kribbella sp. NPDC056345 TaxID=3345789 RepID=UPI0035DD5004
MTANPGSLGAFLRAHREQVAPAAAGVEVTRRRQVRGLRREEVAVRAGLSTDYYTRLEQGRECHPSSETLSALTEALRLDRDNARYLRALVAPVGTDDLDSEQVSPGIAQLVKSRSGTPAIVLGRYLDVLMNNEIAGALTQSFTTGRNLLTDAFVDPELRRLYGAYWPFLCAGVVAGLRTATGSDLQAPRLVGLVETLSARSDEFRKLWTGHKLTPHGRGSVMLTHPWVGPVWLDYEAMRPAGATRQVLVMFVAEQGSPSAKALAKLGGAG